MSRAHTLLIIITALGAFLRFTQLTSIPPALYWDEVAIGYNAHSIAITGTDEYGTPFPFWFRSYDDYKLPGYIYTLALAINFFGFSEYLIRSISALAGTLSIIAVYFLAKELSHSVNKLVPFPMISAFLFATSPWSIQFSRAAFEANLALLFLITALYCLLYGYRRNSKTLIISAVLFCLSIFTYHSSRLFVPLFLITFLFTHQNIIKSKLPPTLVAFTVGLLIILPTLPAQFSTQGQLRIQSTSYLSNSSLSQSVAQFTQNYVSHFDPDYLFFHGDQIGRHSTRELGMHLYLLIPLIIIGFFSLKLLPKKSTMIIITWLLLAPIPASLANQNPHALRSLLILPAWIFIAGLGATKLFLFFKSLSHRIQFVASTITVLLFIYNFTIFYTTYFYIYPTTTAPDWSYGAKQAINIISSSTHVDRIYLTSAIPPIYLAAYLPITPQEFQTLPHSTHTNKNLTIRNITYFDQAWDIAKDPNETRLFIAPWSQPPPDYATRTGVIKTLNGDTIYNYWYEFE